MSTIDICCYCSKLAEVKKCSSCRIENYCSRECQKSDWKYHKVICKNIDGSNKIEEVIDFEKKRAKIEVKSSSVQGQGVFATEDISSGELICYFDGPFKEAKIKISMSKSETGVLSIKNAGQVFDSILESRAQHDMCVANPGEQKKTLVRIGLDAPATSFGVGQFVNDFACPDIEALDFDQALSQLQVYAKKSLEQSNCELDSKFWYRASRPIKKGQELFTHYGVEFWLQKLLLEAVEPEKRFLLYSCQRQSVRPFDLRKFYEYDEETCELFLEKLIQMNDDYKHRDGLKAKDVIMTLTEKINIK